jgi:Flp pilus assembly protein TadB
MKNLLGQIWHQVVKLFVDDGALAFQVVLGVTLVAAAVKLLGVSALWAAGLLVPVCLIILWASVMRAKKKG